MRSYDNNHRSFERGEMGHSIQSKQDANNLKISPLESLEEVQADLSLGNMHLVYLIPRNVREVTFGSWQQ